MCHLVIFFIGHMDVIGVWLGDNQKTNTVKMDWTSSSTLIYMLQIQ